MPGPAGQAQQLDRCPGAGAKSALRILGVQPHLDRMAARPPAARRRRAGRRAPRGAAASPDRAGGASR